MTTTKANALRQTINFQAAELRDAEQTETKAEIRCRKEQIRELERQLTEG